MREHRCRNLAPADRRHPSQDDVGPIRVGRADHALQRLRAEHVVGVDKEHVPSRSVVEADVAWPRRIAGIRLVDDPQIRCHRGRLVEQLAGAVPRTVVDGHDLHPAGVDGLIHHRRYAVGQIWHRVVDGDDHGDVRWPGTQR
jgi:hypothetical protein